MEADVLLHATDLCPVGPWLFIRTTHTLLVIYSNAINLFDAVIPHFGLIDAG